MGCSLKGKSPGKRFQAPIAPRLATPSERERERERERDISGVVFRLAKKAV